MVPVVVLIISNNRAKGAKAVLGHYDNNLALALLEIFPEIGLVESNLVDLPSMSGNIYAFCILILLNRKLLARSIPTKECIYVSGRKGRI